MCCHMTSLTAYTVEFLQGCVRLEVFSLSARSPQSLATHSPCGRYILVVVAHGLPSLRLSH